MSTIRLSAPAIMRMMEAGDEGKGFRLELQRYVAKDVVRQIFAKDMDKSVLDVINAAVKTHAADIMATGDHITTLQEMAKKRVADEIASVKSAWRKPKVSDTAASEIAKAVDEMIENKARDLINEKSGLVANVVGQITDRIVAGLEGNIATLVERKVNAEVAERINAGVVAKLNEVVAKVAVGV